MFLGASSPANRPRPRLVDLNLVPVEYRRKPFPFLTVGLVLLAIGAVLLLYVLYYARGYSALEDAQLSSRVAQGQSLVLTATGDPAALARQQKLRAMRDDYQVLAQRQINWGDVFQTIADVPSGVLVRSVSQAGFGVTVAGSAINQEAAAKYLQQLRSSGLFVNASIQVQPSNRPLVFATPTLPPTPIPTPRPIPTPVPAIVSSPPPPRPTATTRPQQPLAKPTNTAIPTKQATATATITPTPTQTGTPKPTSTPANDFALISVVQVATSNPNAPNSDIKGQVLDAKGKGVAGLTIEIDSEGQPPWSSQTTTASDGTFDFNVNHGKFQVEVVAGRSQIAKDLYTGADGTPGTLGYQLVFEETFTGPVPTVPPGMYTPTWTPTADPTATVTPVSNGANIANDGCAKAYVYQNGQRNDISGSTNPSQAIDGNMGTEWNSGVTPSSGTYVVWSWQLPKPGQTSPCSASGIDDSQDQINGIELYPDQSAGGNTTHELWLYSDANCSVNLASTGAAYFVWQQYTDANTVLPLTFSQLPVRCVIIRTLSDPSNVAWKEVQIFQALPPPNGFPTLTPSPVSSATPTSTPTQCTPTCTPTPTVTASLTPTPTITTTGSPTSTWTVTPTYTAYPSSGISISACGVAYQVSLGTPAPAGPSSSSCTPTPSATYSPAQAIDGDLNTFWDPVAPGATPVGDPQYLVVHFGSSPLYVPDLSHSISDIQIVAYAPSGSTGHEYDVSVSGKTVCSLTPTAGVFTDSATLDCPLATPVAAAAEVSVGLVSTGQSENGSFGIRELRIFEPVPSQQAARSAASTAGQGRGPGLEDLNGPNLPPNLPSQAPVQYPAPVVGTPLPPPPSSGAPSVSANPAANQSAPITGPVDFTIVLETASGKGYP